MSDPKKHHILPQFYLEFFSRNGRLQIYDRNKQEFREGTPLGTAFQKHFYSVERKDGTKDASIEKWLSNIEGRAKAAILTLKQRKPLSHEGEAYLALFAGLMWTRTVEFDRSVKLIAEPLLKKALRDVVTFENAKTFFSDREESLNPALLETKASEVFRILSSDTFKIELNRNMPLQQMVNVAGETADILLGMNWIYMHPPSRGSFVTCDNPFILIPPDDYRDGTTRLGLATPGVFVLLPLAQDLALVAAASGGAREHRETNQPHVRYMNLETTLQSDRLLIGRDKALLESLVKQACLEHVQKHSRTATAL